MYENVIAVTNRKLVKGNFEDQIRMVCLAHPKAIVLREKDLTSDDYLVLAGRVDEICKRYHVPLILHNFPNVAKKLGKTRIQLPLPVLKSLPEKEKVNFERIGTSVHSVEEAEEAVGCGADYLVAGHIFTTECKKGIPPRGLDFLRAVCSKVQVPVYGIGGIKRDKEQISSVLAAGAAGVCIMSDMMNLNDAS